MLIRVDRPQLRYWFWRAGERPQPAYLYLVYGVYDPELRQFTGYVCGTYRRSGRCWVSLRLFAAKTRLTDRAAKQDAIKRAKAAAKFDGYTPEEVLRMAGAPFRMGVHDSVELAEELVCR